MYVINPYGKNPIFQINQHIGFDRDTLGENGQVIEAGDGQGIDGVIFANEVLSLNDCDIDLITFYINCMGGDVKQSLDMFNAIAQSKHKTYSLISAFAYSCGGWIPMAADKIDMVEETGSWMCHMPYDPLNPDNKSQFMDSVVEIISKTIASKSGRNGKPKKTQDEIKELMKEKTYWDAKRMYEEGLIDRIVNASGKVIKLEKEITAYNKQELNHYYKEYQTALNKEVQTKIKIQNPKNNIMSFAKAVNRFNAISKEKTGISFNLTEDSSEDVIIDAISRLENRLRAMNDEMMDKEKEVTEAKTSQEENRKKLAEAQSKAENSAMCAAKDKEAYDKMKNDYDAMDAENKELKNKEKLRNEELATSDLKFRTERATNFVQSLIDTKKVNPSANMPLEKMKDFLIKEAIENFDKVVATYDLIPSTFKPAKPGLKNSEIDNKEGNIVEKLIASNIEKIKKSQFKMVDGQKIPLYA